MVSDNKKVVFFDMHGILFFYSSSHDTKESNSKFDEIIEKYSESSEEFSGAWDDYQNNDVTLALRIENISVKKGINGDSNELQIFEIPAGVEKLLERYKKDYHIVIISTSEEDTSQRILEYLLKDKNIDFEKFMRSIDIINMEDFGSKKDVNAWVQAMSPYSSVTDIFEDGEKNIKAAGLAARKLGYTPKLHTIPTS